MKYRTKVRKISVMTRKRNTLRFPKKRTIHKKVRW